MSKHIQLNIADPCHENWDNMTPAARGKFCGSCQKKVIDFSNMSDREVAQFFKRPSTCSVCGRFMQDQLDRSIQIPKKRIPWVKYFFQFALPAFLMSLKASAQKEIRLTGKVSAICSRQLMGDTILVSMEREVVDTTVIKGRVVDKKGEAISFASIMIKDTKIGVATDDTGTFSIKLKPGMKNIVLVASSVGFEMKEVNVKSGDQNNLIIQLNAKQMLAEVIVTSDISRKLGGLMWVTSIRSTRNIFTPFFRADSVKVYPNPVSSGGAINIDVVKSATGKTLIELYSMAGQKVYSTEVTMNNKNWRATLSLPSLVPGIYIVNVYFDEKKKAYSTKLVIE